jgi:methionyl-tRNA formyltransferase
VVIALGHPHEKGGRRVRRTLGRRALVLGRPELEDVATQAAIASARPDVIVSWFWPKLIPACLLALPARGAFGVHPSLLPRWRGPDPYFWALYTGDTRTGVTLHRLAPEYDTGAIIASRALAIEPSDTAWTLAKRLDRPSLALLVETVHRLSAGDLLLGEPQDEGAVTEAPAPTDELLTIDWKQSVAAVLRLVRATSPYPGALTDLGDAQVDVLWAEPSEEALPRALEPGDAVLGAHGVVVRAGDGGVLLKKVRTDDGELFTGRAVAELFEAGLTDLSTLSRAPSGGSW